MKTITHKEQQERWDKRIIKIQGFVQMDSTEMSGGVKNSSIGWNKQV